MEEKGFGAIYGKFWTFSRWEPGFIKNKRPSIAFLELYALCIGIFCWGQDLKKFSRILIHCDNKSVRDMVNHTTSGCENCMILIRMLTLRCIELNLRVFVKYVKSADNGIADSLSRLEFTRFRRLTKDMKINKAPTPLPQELWPVSNIWRL